MKHGISFLTLFLLALLGGFVLGTHARSAFAQASGDTSDDSSLFNFGDTSTEEQKTKAPLNQYDKKYRPLSGSQAQQSGTGLKTLIPNYIYLVTFLRLPDANPHDLTLRIVSPGTVSGCLNMKKAEITYKIIGHTIALDLTEAEVDVDRSTVRTAQYQCDLSSQTSMTDVTLNLDEVRNRKIDKISLKSKTVGKFVDVKLEIQDKYVKISSALDNICFGRRFLHRRKTEEENSFTFWFYPEQTLALSSNALDMTANKEALTKIKTLAREKGLTPLEEIFTDFTPSPYNHDKVYVVDEKNLYRNDLKKQDDRVLIGNVTSAEVFTGPEGPYNKTIEKHVYARIPGIYE